MSFRRDDEYYDDGLDDEHDEDDYDEDDDEETSPYRRTNLPGKNPFAGSSPGAGLPGGGGSPRRPQTFSGGSSGFGGGGSSDIRDRLRRSSSPLGGGDDGDEDDDDDEETGSGARSPFTGLPGRPAPRSTGMPGSDEKPNYSARPSAETRRPSPSPYTGSSGPPGGQSSRPLGPSGGQGGQSGRPPSGGGYPPRSGAPSPRSPGDNPRSGTPGGPRTFGGPSVRPVPREGDDAPKPDEKAPDAPKEGEKSGGGGLAGLRNRFGGGNKPDEKKPDAPKEDGEKSGGGLGAGLRNRLGGGGKADEKKPDAPKEDGEKSGGGLGAGLRNRLGGGGKTDAQKPDDAQKPAAPVPGGGRPAQPDGNARPGGGGGAGRPSPLGQRRPAGGAPPGGGAAAQAASGPGAQADGEAKAKPKGGGLSPFGQKKASGEAPADAKKAGKKASAGKKDAAAQNQGGMMGNLRARFGGGGQTAAASTSRPKQPKTAKVPKADESAEGLTLDNWLDILGVALVFGSLVIALSAISPDQAAIQVVLNFLGEIVGWGAVFVPGIMFIGGMWLIVRHFGDEAPTFDPIRLVGWGVMYVCTLVGLQYAHALTYTGVTNFQLLELRVRIAYEIEQAGGGLVGGYLYLQLVSLFTEIGGFLILLLVAFFAFMLITRLSVAEMAMASISLWREWRSGMARSAAKRRAQKLARQQKMQERLTASQAKLEAARQANIQVSRPDPAQLGAGAANALPEPQAQNAEELPVGQRDILFRRGGQAMTNEQAAQLAAQNPTSAPASATPQPLGDEGGALPQQPAAQHAAKGQDTAKKGGLLGRLRGKNQDAKGQTAADNAQKGGLLGRGKNQAAAPPTPSPAGNGQHMPLGDQIQPAASADTSPQTNGHSAAPDQTPRGEAHATPPAASEGQTAPQAEPAFAAAQAQADATHEAQTEAASPVNPLAARQERLNAIRQGQVSPQASTQSAAGLQSPLPDAPAPQRSPSFGRPEDIITHPSEHLPFQQQATANQGYAADDGASPPAQPAINPDRPSARPQPASSEVKNQTKVHKTWKLPDYRTLLATGSEQEFDRQKLLKSAQIIEDTLNSFGAPGRVVEVNTGPVITQFGVEPDYVTGRGGKKQRIKVSAIAQLDKDLQLALGAKSIRVEAPVPGKGYVGIEVPNDEAATVSLRDVMETDSFRKIKSPLGIALGQSVSGAPVSADLTSMPHLLIAGTTGSGKSVCVNSVIASILAHNTPDKVKFIMVDPKRVELTGYNGIPHLVAPVVVEMERILGVLKWVTREMDERYKKFSDSGARHIEDYNKHRDATTEPMPYIVVIIDELADLMMLAPEETERTISRIAALARATGIHLVIATQRPSVDVVTGLIKANFPARIAFAVAGSVDSRVILDQPGAERLLGRGDMLYMSGNSPAPLRLQGVFLSDMEITNITRYWKMQALQQPDDAKPGEGLKLPSVAPDDEQRGVLPRGERVKQQAFWDASAASDDDDDFEDGGGLEDAEDELYENAVEMVRRLDKASVSLLQRRLRIGYTRAARLIDMMEERGVVGPAKEGSSKPRDVLPEG